MKIEEQQNMSPQIMTVGLKDMLFPNMPFWYVDCFEL